MQIVYVKNYFCKYLFVLCIEQYLNKEFQIFMCVSIYKSIIYNK